MLNVSPWTAHPGRNALAARKAGVSNYIVKPFNAQTLQSKIEAVFRTPEEAAAMAATTQAPAA